MSEAWPNLSDLLVAGDAAAPVGLVGAPLGMGSVTPGRCDLAPDALRAVLRRIGRFDIDTMGELGCAVADHGDVAVAGLSIEEACSPIAAAVEASVRAHALTLLIGGHNGVTRPGLRGMAAALGVGLDRVGLITIDAHFDLRETAGGLSNGNPVRALIEDGLPGRNISQNGLAPFANTLTMARDAEAAGIAVTTLADCHRRGMAAIVGEALAGLAHVEAIMVDFDIDAIDRAQFPGAPGGRAGGLDSAMFFEAARLLCANPRVRLVDLTEWDPPLDPSDLSALTAGRWVAEVLAGFEARYVNGREKS